MKVVVATQFLDSLITELTPKHSECNDIVSSYNDGANSILLTGETANGGDAVNAIDWLRKILETAGAKIEE